MAKQEDIPTEQAYLKKYKYQSTLKGCLSGITTLFSKSPEKGHHSLAVKVNRHGLFQTNNAVTVRDVGPGSLSSSLLNTCSNFSSGTEAREAAWLSKQHPD